MRNLYIAQEMIAGKIIPGFRIGYSQPPNYLMTMAKFLFIINGECHNQWMNSSDTTSRAHLPFMAH